MTQAGDRKLGLNAALVTDQLVPFIHYDEIYAPQEVARIVA
jgi:hypothetical protein